MKISDLSQASQVPVPTIKFYIREGLLPAGRRTSRNQASYDAAHLERLLLIRALQDAGLRLEVIARALRAADSGKEHFVIAAIDALERPVAEGPDESAREYKQAQTLLMSMIRQRGWQLKAGDVSVCDATRALCTIRQLFMRGEPDAHDLEVYVQAADMLAAHEIPEDWQPEAAREAALRYAMLGTVLFEPLLLALRRMAHVARTRRVLKAQPRKRTPRSR